MERATRMSRVEEFDKGKTWIHGGIKADRFRMVSRKFHRHRQAARLTRGTLRIQRGVVLTVEEEYLCRAIFGSEGE
jgi:hypothetical protein